MSGAGALASRDWLIPAAWAAWIGALATLILVWTGDGISSALLGGAAVAVGAGAGVRALLGREVVERELGGTSAAPPLIAAGATLALNGVAFGLWLLLIGAELVAFGVALLIREGRKAR